MEWRVTMISSMNQIWYEKKNITCVTSLMLIHLKVKLKQFYLWLLVYEIIYQAKCCLAILLYHCVIIKDSHKPSIIWFSAYRPKRMKHSNRCWSEIEVIQLYLRQKLDITKKFYNLPIPVCMLQVGADNSQLV